jgi:hypothetical protein
MTFAQQQAGVAMDISDFVKQPRGPRSFDVWTARQSIPTPMGDFSIDLQMRSGDKSPPSEAMLRQAEKLIGLLRTHVQKIHDMVFESYQMAADDEEWLDSCGVPAGLDRTGIIGHLQHRSLTVSADADEDGKPTMRVFIIPDWDEEHAIFLAHRDGAWEFVDC